MILYFIQSIYNGLYYKMSKQEDNLGVEPINNDQGQLHQQIALPTAILPHQEENAGTITHWGYFILFSYMYLIQGVVTGFAATMPYIYPELPDISTMALFNSVNLLPFSFKFLVAPFLEKYSFIEYGKRKTWIMISMSVGGLVIIVASFYTDLKYANLFAILCFVCQCCMVFMDISTHALMVKQLKSPTQSSIILSYPQTLGGLIGGLLLLKLTSKQFSESVGLSQPITTPQILLLIFGLMTLIPILIIHFKFKQTVLESQKRGIKFSFCEIISYYKVFLRPSSRYFRTCLYFLFFNQGFNFFLSLYDYNLVQAGFSRDTSNTIDNCVSIFIVIFTFYLGYVTKFFGGKVKSMVCTSIGLITIFLFILIVFPLQVLAIIATNTLTSIFTTWQFFVWALLINQFPVHALSGMFITMNASFSNFGKMTSVQTWICGKLGWKLCSFIGLGIQLILTIITPKYFDWMMEGDVHVPPEIQQPFEVANEGHQAKHQ